MTRTLPSILQKQHKFIECTTVILDFGFKTIGMCCYCFSLKLGCEILHSNLPWITSYNTWCPSRDWRNIQRLKKLDDHEIRNFWKHNSDTVPKWMYILHCSFRQGHKENKRHTGSNHQEITERGVVHHSAAASGDVLVIHEIEYGCRSKGWEWSMLPWEFMFV